MPVKLVVFTAVTVDWSRMTDWHYLHNNPFPLKMELWPRVKMWNQTFNISYYAYRDEVKKIARECLSRVEGVSLVTSDWSRAKQEGGLIVCVDDDDWFNPALKSVLERHYEPHYEGYLWHYMRFSGNRYFVEGIDDPPDPKRLIWVFTNNCALPPAGYHKYEFNPQTHMRQDNLFRQPGFKLKVIDDFLSCTHKTMASFSILKNLKTLESLLGFWELTQQTPRQRPEAAWAEPFLEMTAQLNKKLKPRIVKYL